MTAIAVYLHDFAEDPAAGLLQLLLPLPEVSHFVAADISGRVRNAGDLIDVRPDLRDAVVFMSVVSSGASLSIAWISAREQW